MVLPALAVKYPSGDAYREGQLGAQRVQSNALGMETQKLQNKGIERKHAIEGLRLVGGIAMGALNGDIDGQADPERWAQGMAELERMGLDTSSFKDNPQMASMLARNSLTTLQQVNMATNEAAVQESLRRFDITNARARRAEGRAIEKHELKMSGDDETFGKSPSLHTVDGKLRYGVFGDKGTFKSYDDVNAVEPIMKIDTGEGTRLLGGKTGKQVTGDVSKNVGKTAAEKKAAEQAIKISGEAVERLGKIRTNMANLTQAIKALEDGANTGAIAQYFPSIQTSSIELSNIQKRLGLDVIGDVTFGALSKGELDLALATAIPVNMEEEPLKKWLTQKRDAQEKYIKILGESARFLSKPGNTLNDWLEIKGVGESQTYKNEISKPVSQRRRFNPETGKLE